MDKSILKDITGKNILIIGCPASGKTFFSKLLANEGHKVFHTDDYMRYGYKESLYAMMEDLAKHKGNTIVEGVQGYRLLRKGVEMNNYYPDIVIELEVPESRMLKTYREQRPGKKIDSLIAFNKTHQTILNDYKSMPNSKKPLWIKLQNNY